MNNPPEHLAEWCLADTDSPWDALSLATWLASTADASIPLISGDWPWADATASGTSLGESVVAGE